MDCKLNRNLIPDCDYSIGGITNIWILDIDDFEGYLFKNDNLYDEFFVDNIYTKNDWYELDSVNESIFNEKTNNNLFEQDLTTFIRIFDSESIKSINLLKINKYIVAFRSYNGKYYIFGNEGVSITYTLTTGTKGEFNGYQLNMTIKSTYSIYQLNSNYFSSPHQVKYTYKPLFDEYYNCELDVDGNNTGYQVATVSVRISNDGQAVDINGQLCSKSGLQQAAMILQGTTPPSNYDIVGTYTSNDLIEGISVKQQNYTACKPFFIGSITLDNYTVSMTDNKRTVNVIVTSEHNWSIINYNSNWANSNYISGSAGVTTTTLTIGSYGNHTFIYKNLTTQEEVELLIQNCAVIIPNNNLVIEPDGEIREISVNCIGGNSEWEIQSQPSWCVASPLNNYGTISIDVEPNNTNDARSGQIILQHKTDNTATAIITMIQQPSIHIVIPDFNYLTFRYFWADTDGQDLDTATVLVNTGLFDNGVAIDDKAVGWNQPGNTIPEIQKYLQFGGDNTGSGNECVFIDWLTLCSEENLPNLPDEIYCDMYANWYREKLTGNMSFEISAYKGGTMVKDPSNSYNWINEGGELKFQGIELAYVDATGSGNAGDYKNKYTYTARITYNKITQNATLQIIS